MAHQIGGAVLHPMRWLPHRRHFQTVGRGSLLPRVFPSRSSPFVLPLPAVSRIPVKSNKGSQC